MKLWLLLLLVVPQGAQPPAGPEAAAMAAEQAGQLREAFLSYIAAIQALPDPPPLEDERRLREKLIRLVGRLAPQPRVPEEAERFGMRGMIALKDAKDERGYQEAAAEFRKALRLAPWWAAAAYNLALVQEKLKQYDAALVNLRLSLLAEPDTPKAAEIRAKLVELEYRQEKRGAARATLERGRNLAAGRGVTRDRAGAVAAYVEACEAGELRGCAYGGWLYRFGEGVPKDEARAGELFKKACDHGVASACRGLRPPSGQGKPEPEPVILQGEPALRFEEGSRWAKDRTTRLETFVLRSEYQGAPALRLLVIHGHGGAYGNCTGFLSLTSVRVGYEPKNPKHRDDNFDTSRATLKEITPHSPDFLTIPVPSRKYDFMALGVALDKSMALPIRVPPIFLHAIADFPGAMAEVDRLTADLREALGEEVSASQ